MSPPPAGPVGWLSPPVRLGRCCRGVRGRPCSYHGSRVARSRCWPCSCPRCGGRGGCCHVLPKRVAGEGGAKPLRRGKVRRGACSRLRFSHGEGAGNPRGSPGRTPSGCRSGSRLAGAAHCRPGAMLDRGGGSAGLRLLLTRLRPPGPAAGAPRLRNWNRGPSVPGARASPRSRPGLTGWVSRGSAALVTGEGTRW